MLVSPDLMSFIARLLATRTVKGMWPRSESFYTSADRNYSFVEFENAADLRTAVEKLDNREFKGQRVTCVANVRNILTPR